ncbi:MAG: SOS response-associated peptidase family protein [Eubacteriales bacterium]|nr:SOS response-associated peptidase family protein [Eubacteriales bacterium]
MCCRYYVPGEMSEFMLLKYLNAINDNKPKHGEIFPTDMSPVIYGGDNIAVTSMKWGFSSQKGPVFNARGETFEEKAFFRPYADNRCAAFCSEYYEWNGKVKYAVRAKNDKPIFLAGIYRSIPGQGSEFTIITLPPVIDIAPLHDRMPLAVTNEAAEEWLAGRDIQYVFRGVQELCYERA